MKRFKHLLVHLDLEGAHDAAALRHATAIGRLSRSQHTGFVHTSPDFTLSGEILDESPALVATWLREAKAELARAVGRHFRRPRGCRMRLEVLGGARLQDLLELLRQRDIDLVLVGRSDTNGGFVEKLVRKAPCSVMVVPPGASAAYRRILVTTDFSEYSAGALEVGLAFAQARHLRRLWCFHGYQIPYGHRKTGIPRDEFRREVEAWVERRYRDQAAALRPGSTRILPLRDEAPVVSQGILRRVEEQRSDLLVMGARGKDALSAALLGSTTAEVVRETRVPTLVVKPKGAGRAFLDLLLGN